MGPLILQQTGLPKQIYERQMVAANERGEREGAMEGSLEGGGKVKRGVRWETCRWISLRSGGGCLTSRLTAALRPQWRLLPGGPQDLGPQQGAAASSITAELRVEMYFLSLPAEQTAHLHRHFSPSEKKKQVEKHLLKSTATHAASGRKCLQSPLSLFLPLLPSEV